MPHQFQVINCKKCGENYCPVCKEKCPKCGEKDIADEKTMMMREQMKRHLNRKIEKLPPLTRG